MDLPGQLQEACRCSAQVERAFDVLKENAEGEILEAAKAQVAQRTEKLLSAVDVDKFLQGALPLGSPHASCQHTTGRGAACCISLEVWHGNQWHHWQLKFSL